LEPRKAIGTTNTAEFLVSLSASVGFLLGLGSSAIPWDAVIALIIGGVLAAPLAAWLLTKVPQQILGLVVGFVIVLLNTRQIAVSFDAPGGVLWTLLALVAVAGIVTVVTVVRRKKSVR
jgi:hypothetical protein